MFTWDAGKDEVMFPVILKIAYCSKANGINTHCYIFVHSLCSSIFLLTVSHKIHNLLAYVLR